MKDAQRPRDYLRLTPPAPKPQRTMTHSDLLLIVAAAISRSIETGLPFERALVSEIIEEMDQPLQL